MMVARSVECLERRFAFKTARYPRTQSIEIRQHIKDATRAGSMDIVQIIAHPIKISFTDVLIRTFEKIFQITVVEPKRTFTLFLCKDFFKTLFRFGAISSA
jgi:hypothetical protein